MTNQNRQDRTMEQLSDDKRSIISLDTARLLELLQIANNLGKARKDHGLNGSTTIPRRITITSGFYDMLKSCENELETLVEQQQCNPRYLEISVGKYLPYPIRFHEKRARSMKRNSDKSSERDPSRARTVHAVQSNESTESGSTAVNIGSQAIVPSTVENNGGNAVVQSNEGGAVVAGDACVAVSGAVASSIGGERDVYTVAGGSNSVEQHQVLHNQAGGPQIAAGGGVGGHSYGTGEQNLTQNANLAGYQQNAVGPSAWANYPAYDSRQYAGSMYGSYPQNGSISSPQAMQAFMQLLCASNALGIPFIGRPF